LSWLQTIGLADEDVLQVPVTVTRFTAVRVVVEVWTEMTVV
jgi:hypothetical protein